MLLIIEANVPSAAAVPAKIEINLKIYSQLKENLFVQPLDLTRHCGLALCYVHWEFRSATSVIELYFSE